MGLPMRLQPEMHGRYRSRPQPNLLNMATNTKGGARTGQSTAVAVMDPGGVISAFQREEQTRQPITHAER